MRPVSARGSRPPLRPRKLTPIRLRGSITRRIGRERKEASPVRKLVKPWPESRPINSRAPVPALPISSTPSGSARPPTPTPHARQLPGPRRSSSTPMARRAPAVASTSSPSSSPSMRLSPTAMAASIKERWEIDLSPGRNAAPESAPCGAARNNIALQPAGSSRRLLPRSRGEFAFDSLGPAWQLPGSLRTRYPGDSVWPSRNGAPSGSARAVAPASTISAAPRSPAPSAALCSTSRSSTGPGVRGRRGGLPRWPRPGSSPTRWRSSPRPRPKRRSKTRWRSEDEAVIETEDDAEEDESLIEDVSELGEDEDMSDVIEGGIDDEPR